MAKPKKAIKISRAQTAYLIELVADDIADPEISNAEKQMAQSLLTNLHEVRQRWHR